MFWSFKSYCFSSRSAASSFGGIRTRKSVSHVIVRSPLRDIEGDEATENGKNEIASGQKAEWEQTRMPPTLRQLHAGAGLVGEPLRFVIPEDFSRGSKSMFMDSQRLRLVITGSDIASLSEFIVRLGSRRSPQ